MNSVLTKSKLAIWSTYSKNHGCPVPDTGYVSCPEENLLSSAQLLDFYSDLEAGSGNELQKKFCALHSSSALAVNTFATWKRNPTNLSLCGREGFTSLTFERKCPTGLGGTSPNLDVFLDNNLCVIAVESKFLEYLTPKKGCFSESYTRDKLPQAEDSWWHLIDRIKHQPKQHLDAAQLVKHYLGLRNLAPKGGRETVLLYLFWEPENCMDFPVFHKHREEIADFASHIEESSVKFIAQSYLALWDEWEHYYGNTQHVSELRKRYQLTI